MIQTWEITRGLKKVESVRVSNRRLICQWLLSHCGTDQLCPRMTINELPDEVLLGIFEFSMAYPLPPPSYEEDAWHTLVHVCRRWRYVVFGSPRRLDLRLLCMNRRLVKTPDIWPELPIVIHVADEKICHPPSVTNVISLLKRHDRVCKIFIDGVPNSLLKELATTCEPFPALIELELASFKNDPPIVPDSFLGGSVPRLRSLILWGIPFPAIGKLLWSTRDLVTLSLGYIPHSGYISPETMVANLSGLTMLESLHLSFETPQCWTHGASRRPPALTRVVLPALTTFDFAGNSKYLGDIVSRIDAPLDCIAVTVAFPDQDQLVFDSDFPLLRDFIGRTKMLNAPHRAETTFSNFNTRICLFQRKGGVDFKVLNLAIPYDALESQLSALTRACSSLLLPLHSLEHLSIYKSKSELWPFIVGWQNEVENPQWMELFRHFITVKDLVLGESVVLSVASALQELVGERVTEILPALQNIFLEGFQSSSPVPEGIAKFIAARELSGRPVVVHHQGTKQ